MKKDATLGRLTLLGIEAEWLSPQLWQTIAGMENEKELIERKILWPLLHPQLAQKHGVFPPRAILLFGPPGTGKTSFARGISGRLGWAFVEVSPSSLLTDGLSRQPLHLKRLFEALARVSQSVVFFDEFETLALGPERASPAERLASTEMLRQLPRLREGEGRLLVCATNNIHHLTPALLRPGRFDFILPIGPMDREARRAVFQHYLQRLNRGEIDMNAILDHTALYTPADIQAVCSQVAQTAFEREITEKREAQVATQDLLAAIEGHKPTLTQEDMGQFKKDIQQYCRADYCPSLL